MATPLTIAGQNGLQSFSILDVSTNEFVDLTSSVDGILLVESIDTSTMAATATISDFTDLLNIFPLRGDEHAIINLKAETNSPEETIERTLVFRITKVENIGIESERVAAGIEITMISEFAYEQEFINIDEYFSDTITNTVTKIHNKVIDTGNLLASSESYELKTTETNGSMNFIIPSETPFDSINRYCCGWAFNQDYLSSLWYYFQSTKGYRFINIEQVYEEAPAANDDYWKSHTYSTFSKNENTDPAAMYTALSFRQLSRNNSFALASIGAINHNVKELSYTFKSFDTQSYNYLDQSYNIEGSELIRSDDYVEKYSTVPKETHWLYRDSTASNFYNYESMPHKWAMSRLFYNNILQMNVVGNPALTVGELVDIQVPRQTTFVSGELQLDKTISGKYIIKDIQTQLGVGTYRQQLNLIRPGAVEFGKVED